MPARLLLQPNEQARGPRRQSMENGGRGAVLRAEECGGMSVVCAMWAVVVDLPLDAASTSPAPPPHMVIHAVTNAPIGGT